MRKISNNAGTATVLMSCERAELHLVKQVALVVHIICKALTWRGELERTEHSVHISCICIRP